MKKDNKLSLEYMNLCDKYITNMIDLYQRNLNFIKNKL
jgi:hypothetical protein